MPKPDRRKAFLAAGFLALAAAGGYGAAATATQSGAGSAAESTATAETSSAVRLVMIEQAGCYYCRQWDEEIAPGYDRTAEGAVAPLLRVDLDGPYPDGLALARRPHLTPTFILIRDGQELDRLEGYPGEHFFWPLLRQMIARHDVPLTSDAANG